MESVLPNIGGGIMNSIPDFTGPAAPLQDAPDQAPTSVGLPPIL